MTAAILLPLVPLVVCASTGAAVAGLDGVDHGTITTVSFLLWSCGEGLALGVIAVYFWKLVSHSVPPSAAIVSTFLPVGPLGQGGFGIVIMGRLVDDFNLAGDPVVSRIVRFMGTVVGLALLGFGTFWIIIALWSTGRHFPRRFSVGWWASTFPVGTYALVSGAVGREMDSAVLKWLGSIMSVVVVVFWGVCVVGTAWRGVWFGEMFVAPCVVEKEEREGRVGGLGQCGGNMGEEADDVMELDMTR